MREQNKNIDDEDLAREAHLAQGLSLLVHSGGARPLRADWRDLLDQLPEDWRDLYEERAALIEYDGGEKRATAERRAFECVMMQAEAAGFSAAFWGRRDGGAGEACAVVN
jgi:hypothetical protein